MSTKCCEGQDLLQGSVAHPQLQSLSESLFGIPEAIRALCGAQSPMDLLKVKVMADWARNFRSVKLVVTFFTPSVVSKCNVMRWFSQLISLIYSLLLDNFKWILINSTDYNLYTIASLGLFILQFLGKGRLQNRTQVTSFGVRVFT